MKQSIILIVVIMLVLIIFNLNSKNSKNEHYAITPTLEVDKLNETVRQYYYNKENREIENINITKDLDLLNNTLQNELIKFRYPIGSFYVQYADVNENYNAQTERLFPEATSPEKLFGGKWMDQWPNEGIFFRTGGTLSQDNRNLGLQEWAVKNLYGWTSWAQAHYTKPDENLDGVFTKYETRKGGTDGGYGTDKGGSNTFDSQRVSNASIGETRLKNRLIKVWRRTG